MLSRGRRKRAQRKARSLVQQSSRRSEHAHRPSPRPARRLREVSALDARCCRTIEGGDPHGQVERDDNAEAGEHGPVERVCSVSGAEMRWDAQLQMTKNTKLQVTRTKAIILSRSAAHLPDRTHEPAKMSEVGRPAGSVVDCGSTRPE